MGKASKFIRNSKEVRSEGGKIAMQIGASLAGAAASAYLSNSVIPKLPGYDTLDIAPKLKDPILFVIGAAGAVFIKEPTAAAFFLGMSSHSGLTAAVDNIPGLDKSDFGLAGIGAAKTPTNWQQLLEAAKADTTKQLPVNEKGSSVEVVEEPANANDVEEELSGEPGQISGMPGEIGDLQTQSSVML